MKKLNVFLVSALILVLATFLITGFRQIPANAANGDNHIVIAWNDLGMHCANADFSGMVILPPYNNFYAQVIKKGDASQGIKPLVISSGLSLNYSIPGNTYSVGKTNFWEYEDLLFGVNLPPNIGLTGKGLSGTMDVRGNAYIVEGVPITPYPDNDLVNEHPFQLAQVDVYDDGNNYVTSTQNVMPVSNEINCISSGCHSSENDIYSKHDGNLPRPVLCASCHGSPALGTTSKGELPTLSEAIHEKHAEHTNDCYKCHPGPKTECLRGTMGTDHNMSCQDCHGSMYQVAQSIKDGRTPWVDEPTCGKCHGEDYAEEPGTLFRLSKGHGGLYCSACHGSTHAILPSREVNDNLQNIRLQGKAGTLSDCTVCHTTNPTGAGPHGLFAEDNGPFDKDGDGYYSDVDCNDNDASINPGAVEVCDGVDNDCNGKIDDVRYDTPYSLSCYPLNVMPNPFTDVIQIEYSPCYTWRIVDYRGGNIDSSNGSVCGNTTIGNADSYKGKKFMMVITNVDTHESISIQLVKSGSGGGGKNGRGK